MKKHIYFLILLLFAFTSCEKYELETKSKGLTEDGKLSTTVNLSALNGAVTVIGQNDPSIDLAAVQTAVDNHDKVILSGVFDFGYDEETGGVEITRPDVTLQGPATIRGGFRIFGIPPFQDFWSYTLSIRAPGVNILDLEFDFPGDTAIIVLSEEDGRPVVIDGNSINSAYASVAATATKGGLKVVNNTQEDGVIGYIARGTEGSTEISNNVISTRLTGIQIYPFNHQLDITNNNITVEIFDGIWIGSWQVTQDSGPEWGNNPPVKIIDNTIEMLDHFASFGAGIMLGTSAHGINNALVKGNTLTGVARYGGLIKQPYGHNNKFINNDLTGLTTYSPQIWTMGGRDNYFLNNKLGIVAPFSVGEWGPAFRDAATLASTINWHLNDFNTPDPVNYNNHFSNNDYSHTGVPGWTENPDESVGAVLLLNFIQKFALRAPDDPYEEPFIMGNEINEHDFPAGTDVCTQVLDLSNLQGDDLVQGTNTIAGWVACEAHVNRATYQLVNNRYKNLGQWLKNVNEKREEVMADKKKREKRRSHGR